MDEQHSSFYRKISSGVVKDRRREERKDSRWGNHGSLVVPILIHMHIYIYMLFFFFSFNYLVLQLQVLSVFSIKTSRFFSRSQR